MYYADKKLSRIGKSSLGVIIPREWLFAMGLHKSGDAIRACYDPARRRIYLDIHPSGSDALSFNALLSNNYEDPNNYTPQARKKYAPSPSPHYTPAQWDKTSSVEREQELAFLKEAEERGFNITDGSDFERFKQIKRDEIYQSNYAPRQDRQAFYTFNDIPAPMLDLYWKDVAPHIGDYKNKSDLHTARGEWLKVINKSLELNDSTAKSNFIRAAMDTIKNKYAKTDDLTDEL